MALAKDRIPHDSNMSSKVQTCVFDETAMKTNPLTSHGVNKCVKSMLAEEDGSQSTNGLSNDSAIIHSPPLCGNGNGYVYKSTSYQLEEAESLINNLMQGSDSLLNFQHSWMASSENNLHQGYYNQLNHVSPRGTTDLRLVQDFSCFQTASAYSTIVSSAKEKQHGESSCGWLYSEEPAAQESVLKKRSSMAENMQAAKKPHITASKTAKVAKPNSSQSKDPQSVAAKNRRERISERLKMLQELIPNGSKVDLVTMLEKAISYVKFLQLQVELLAADEFWPVQGGKAPDISQVRQAIDAILSSQR